MLQLALPLAWDGLMLRTFAPEVWAALAAARRGKRVDAAGAVVLEEEEEDEEGEEGSAGATTAVDSGVLLGNVLKAVGAWALMYLDVVPWETAVAALSIDPAELAMQALEGKGEEEDGEGKAAVIKPLEVPPQAPTTTTTTTTTAAAGGLGVGVGDGE